MLAEQHFSAAFGPRERDLILRFVVVAVVVCGGEVEVALKFHLKLFISSGKVPSRFVAWVDKEMSEPGPDLRDLECFTSCDLPK